MGGFVVITGGPAEQWRSTEQQGRLRHALGVRGRALVEVEHSGAAFVLAVREEWERTLQPGPLISHANDSLVVADATLYVTPPADVPAGSATSRHPQAPSHAFATAWRRWGEECSHRLEGDYAAVVCDDTDGRVYATRDPFGTRPLYFASLPGGGVYASTADAVRLVRGTSDVDATEMFRILSLHFGDGSRSVWREVFEIPAGHHLTASMEGSQPPRPERVRRWWSPTRRAEWTGLTTEEAPLVLRELLGEAVEARQAGGHAAIAMSGGRDSTALVGALWHRRRTHPMLPSLGIISLEYPDGDAGNEDEYVNAIASAFDEAVHWVPTDPIRVFDDAIARADRRLTPDGTPYDGQNRQLATAAVAQGARILLNGHGGDNLFFGTDHYLADWLRTARWGQLYRELRAKDLLRHPRWLLDHVVRPAVPLGVYDLVEPRLGRQLLTRPWESRPYPWLRVAADVRAQIVAEDRAHHHRDVVTRERSLARRMRLWSLTHSGYTRMCQSLAQTCLGAGVELRMPFFDRRIVDFAWSRPNRDLYVDWEQKVVLRRSMDGVLPARVQAPRPARTGMSHLYVRRQLRLELPGLLATRLASPRLADLGVVDAEKLRSAVAGWLAGDTSHEVGLVQTLSCELWLQQQ